MNNNLFYPGLLAINDLYTFNYVSKLNSDPTATTLSYVPPAALYSMQVPLFAKALQQDQMTVATVNNSWNVLSSLIVTSYSLATEETKPQHKLGLLLGITALYLFSQ